jgi:hypothetical protein
MLDALLPAADALASAEGNAAERSARMLAAATAGADATRDMAPRRGRASYIGERAIGHPDPGAVAVATWWMPSTAGHEPPEQTGRRTAASQFAAIPGAEARLTIGVMVQAVRAPECRRVFPSE